MSSTQTTPRRPPPQDCFDTPEAILASLDLTPEEKEQLLEEWEFHARELARAEAEGMAGPAAPRLHEAHGARTLLAEAQDPSATRTAGIRDVSAYVVFAVLLLVPAVFASILFETWIWAIVGAAFVAITVTWCRGIHRRSRHTPHASREPTSTSG